MGEWEQQPRGIRHQILRTAEPWKRFFFFLVSVFKCNPFPHTGYMKRERGHLPADNAGKSSGLSGSGATSPTCELSSTVISRRLLTRSATWMLTFSGVGLALSGRLDRPPRAPLPLPPRDGRPRLPKLMSRRVVMSFTDRRRILPSSSISSECSLRCWRSTKIKRPPDTLIPGFLPALYYGPK